MQFKTMYHIYLYLEWLHIYAILTPKGPFSHNSNHIFDSHQQFSTYAVNLSSLMIVNKDVCGMT